MSWTGSAVIAVVMIGLCAAMAWSTARQAREQVGLFAGEKASAVAHSLDAFDGASEQLTERFYNNFAEGLDRKSVV